MLRDRNIAAVGNVRSNAGGFPKCLAIRSRTDIKLPWNTIEASTCHEQKLLALKWIDNGAVQMLPTLHNIGPDHTVERARKRPRNNSTNGPQVRKVFGNEAVKRIGIPVVVDDYNYNMGGVDIPDQLRACSIMADQD